MTIKKKKTNQNQKIKQYNIYLLQLKNFENQVFNLFMFLDDLQSKPNSQFHGSLILGAKTLGRSKTKTWGEDIQVKPDETGGLETLNFFADSPLLLKISLLFYLWN